MNTKTMRLPPRRVLTPSATTNKRKEREDPFERPKPITTPTTTSKLLKPDRPSPEPISISSSSKGFEPPTPTPTPTPSNQLLAGYLAHEYLTKGTLLGRPWAPPRAEGPSAVEKRKGKPVEEDGGGEGVTAAAACRRTEEERERYAEVAGLLKGGGAHLSGVVNPTQLARFLHL